MEDIEKFANAVRDADLPKNDEILTALGEMYENPVFRKELDRMSLDYARGMKLTAVFMSGFSWKLTKQRHDWWKYNVYAVLGQKRL